MQMNKTSRTISFIILFLSLFFISFLSIIGVSSAIPELTALIWFLSISIFLFFSSSQEMISNNDRLIFWSSYLVQIVVFLFKVIGQDLVSPSLSLDALGFWKVAVQYFNGDYHLRYTFFPYILNAEFHIFGINYACCILTNILFVMVMRICVFAFMNKSNVKGNLRVILSLVTCFMPYQFILSNSILREPLYISFFALAFLLFCLHISAGKQWLLYLSVLLTLPILICHIGYFPVPLCFFLYSIKNRGVKNKRQWLLLFIQIVALLFLILVVLRFDSTTYISGYGETSIESLLNRIAGNNRSEGTELAGSLYLKNLRITNWYQIIYYLPLKLLYFTFSPMPLDWRGIMDVLAFLGDSCVHIVLLCGIGYRIKKQYKTSNSSIIVKCGFWCCILSFVVFALGTSTAGTAIRHRDAMIAIELMTYVCSRAKTKCAN